MALRRAAVIALVASFMAAGCTSDDGGERGDSVKRAPAAAAEMPLLVGGTSGPGAPVRDAITVADGSRLLGAAFPTELDRGWTAVFAVTGGAVAVYDAYVDQARAVFTAAPYSSEACKQVVSVGDQGQTAFLPIWVDADPDRLVSLACESATTTDAGGTELRMNLQYGGGLAFLTLSVGRPYLSSPEGRHPPGRKGISPTALPTLRFPPRPEVGDRIGGFEILPGTEAVSPPIGMESVIVRVDGDLDDAMRRYVEAFKAGEAFNVSVTWHDSGFRAVVQAGGPALTGQGVRGAPGGPSWLWLTYAMG